MTHPLTPREKVAAAIEKFAKEMGDIVGNEYGYAEAILTALASGSGDHAELARLAEAATPGAWRAWITRRRQPEIYTDGGPEDQNDKIASGVLRKEDAAFIAAANPATVLALLAENAALRSDNAALREHRITADLLVSTLKADKKEAERKLAEAVGLLRGVDGGAATEDWWRVKVRTFLSKEAGRG